MLPDFLPGDFRQLPPLEILPQMAGHVVEQRQTVFRKMFFGRKKIVDRKSSRALPISWLSRMDASWAATRRAASRMSRP
jgi:hypothetical protein